MIKSIGIVTTFKANNYGAELQAYASQQVMRNLGYDAELIDYLFYKNRKHKYTASSEPWTHFSFKQKVKHYLFYRILNPLLDICGNKLSKTMAMRTRNFLDFHEKYSHLSKTYYSQDELYNAKLNYDVYCVGSDQVWNPATATSIEPYFLTFAPKGAKKISYASSFGVSCVPEETKQRYIDGLNGLTYISCREKQGVDLVKRLTGRDATHVLDPTLLLCGEEWQEVSENTYCSQKGKYILIYNIIDLDPIFELARRISREREWPILRLCKRALFVKKYEGIINVPMAGPSDFLGLIDNAGMFLTNSFHGCVFAVNFKTPFWALIDEKQKNNSRLESILTLLDIRERLLNTHSNIENLDYMQNLNFEYAHQKLDEERKKSLEYLINAIES